MKKTLNLTILLTAVIMMISLICGTAWAKKPTPPQPVCGLTGTWEGGEASDLYWVGIHTSMDGTEGEMLLNWLIINPNLLTFGGSVAAVKMTPGHGVWQLNSNGTYNYTWYAYGLDVDGHPLYQVRVSGVASVVECDTVNISYSYDVKVPDLTGMEEWQNFTLGTATEKRVPLVTPPVQ
jgi:hypothetical protein